MGRDTPRTTSDIHAVSRRDAGFTIVELLIVVVVIAILAAITIVSYNGISNRAKASAASSAAEQAAKKVMTYAAINSDQLPATLADAGVTDGGASYQYRVDNTTNPKTFCVTATSNNISYFISNTTATPATGACAGHGVNGVAAITNLATNPSVESSDLYWSPNWGTDATGTSSRFANGGWSNHGYYRMTWASNPSVNWGGVAHTYAIPVESGKTYRLSASVRTSSSQLMRVYLRPNNYSTVGDVIVPNTSTTANTWLRVSHSVVMPVGTTYATIRVDRLGSGSWLSGDVLDVGAVLFVQGDADYGYADGNSPGWIWNGTPNNSTSTGPTL